MKKKIEILIARLRLAIRLHPVEVLLSVAFALLGCFHFESGYEYKFLETPLAYFPILFLATYMLNGLFSRTSYRWIYYLSALFCLPFFLWTMERIWTPQYLVSLVVVQLVYLVSGWKKENDEFVRVALRYMKAMLSAGLLAGIAYLLAISIYVSIQYIFEIWQGSDRRFYTEAAYIIYMCAMPLLFLMFNQAKEEGEESRNRLFEVLLNYVLSPALLIYAVILYLYFIKVAILWSLPKGAVAYIVVSFVSATFILKGCQVFLSKRYYDWFYRYASFAVLPALVMYWIGVYYRINQYGFTEPRVYLVAVGGILTGLVALFFTRQWGRYLYAACLAIVFLSAVTYIPGITAEDIERISQTRRGNYPPKETTYDFRSFIEIDGNAPVDISGYRTLIPISGYRSSNSMWTTIERDTFYIFNKAEETIYSEDISTFWNNQLSKASIQPGDTIPEEAFPILLEFDMDSAKLVFQTISLYRSSPDSAYRVSYMTPACYLQKK
ncbi:DUF4153 domain-containing protein [Parabacteroides timonensis]|uniref:DUF4153 domain-containing protein n=1 Tax=Parabacteroides timonensis TaxID=1871013 RepID=UPI00094EEB14|nr:DUF4153 domain-containing protein [Parabacteroides timonensis]